jgi:hypothetical protein
MKVMPELAKTIAREALVKPYRQIKPLPTGKFREWLGERDIHFHCWETMHFLWAVGVLHPIVVRGEALTKTPNLETAGRFEEVDLGWDEPAYVDLGIDVTRVPLMPEWHSKLDRALPDSLLWHPFQLPQFVEVTRILRTGMAIDMALKGPETCSKFAGELVGSVPDGLVRFAQDDRHLSFLRVLALLLATEPLVHPIVHGGISISSMSRETFEGYFEWRQAIDAPGLLHQLGLTVEQTKEWHCDLAIQASMVDPVEHFRVLLQHAHRDDRNRLGGRALLAHDLYDQAEVLRRYLERFHNCELYEEDGFGSGNSQSVKRERYGTHRAADADRQALRRIVRDFGLDPEHRVTWFVEGDTELEYFTCLAEHRGVDLGRAGLILVNLRGKDGIDKDKMLRHLLQQHQRESTFAFISLDQDGGGDHIRVLKRLARDGLLSAGFKIWSPDFEGQNFELVELAEVASAFAQAQGMGITISEADVRRRMQERNQPAGKAIEGLRSHYRAFQGKGADWGKALAEWTAEHPQQRPAEDVFVKLVRARWADYDATIEHLEVDENGLLVERSA